MASRDPDEQYASLRHAVAWHWPQWGRRELAAATLELMRLSAKQADEERRRGDRDPQLR
jgi:hypothetical protein